MLTGSLGTRNIVSAVSAVSAVRVKDWRAYGVEDLAEFWDFLVGPQEVLGFGGGSGLKQRVGGGLNPLIRGGSAGVLA